MWPAPIISGLETTPPQKKKTQLVLLYNNQAIAIGYLLLNVQTLVYLAVLSTDKCKHANSKRWMGFFKNLFSFKDYIEILYIQRIMPICYCVWLYIVLISDEFDLLHCFWNFPILYNEQINHDNWSGGGGVNCETESKRLHVEKQLGKTMKMLNSSYLQMMIYGWFFFLLFLSLLILYNKPWITLIKEQWTIRLLKLLY